MINYADNNALDIQCNADYRKCEQFSELIGEDEQLELFSGGQGNMVKSKKPAADVKVANQLLHIEQQLQKILDGYDCKDAGWYSLVDEACESVDRAAHEARQGLFIVAMDGLEAKDVVEANSRGGDRASITERDPESLTDMVKNSRLTDLTWVDAEDEA